MQSEQFLRRILTDSVLQSEITSIDFETIQAIAKKHGYVISASEVNVVLVESPELALQLQSLIDNSDIEFELDEAEMALISGATSPPVASGPSGPSAPSGSPKVAW